MSEERFDYELRWNNNPSAYRFNVAPTDALSLVVHPGGTISLLITPTKPDAKAVEDVAPPTHLGAVVGSIDLDAIEARAKERAQANINEGPPGAAHAARARSMAPRAPSS